MCLDINWRWWYKNKRILPLSELSVSFSYFLDKDLADAKMVCLVDGIYLCNTQSSKPDVAGHCYLIQVVDVFSPFSWVQGQPQNSCSSLFSPLIASFRGYPKSLCAPKTALWMPPRPPPDSNVAYVPEIPAAPPLHKHFRTFNTADFGKVLHWK